MSDRRGRVAAIALLLLTSAAPVSAQSLDTLRALMARLDAQRNPVRDAAFERRQDSVLAVRARESQMWAESLRRRVLPPLVLSDDSLPLVALSKGTVEEASAIAAGIRRELADFGGFDTTRLGGVVVMSSLISGQRVQNRDPHDRARIGRRRILMFSTDAFGETKGGTAQRRGLVESGIRAVLETWTTDSLRRWIGIMSLPWDTAVYNAAVLTALIRSEALPARRCLDRDGAACADFLGIRENASVESRFPGADAIRVAPWYAGRDRNRARQCGSGETRVCYEILARAGTPSLADEYTHASLVVFIRDRFGPPAMRVVMSDSLESFPARVRRATGLAPDSLGLAWRDWLVSKAGWEPVRAGLRETIPVILLCGALLTLAARSGRWRV